MKKKGRDEEKDPHDNSRSSCKVTTSLASPDSSAASGYTVRKNSEVKHQQGKIHAAPQQSLAQTREASGALLSEQELDRRRRGTGGEKTKHRVHNSRLHHNQPQQLQGPTSSRHQGSHHRNIRLGMRRSSTICFLFVTIIGLVVYFVGKSNVPSSDSLYSNSWFAYKEGVQSSSLSAGKPFERNVGRGGHSTVQTDAKGSSEFRDSMSELVNPFKSQPPPSISISSSSSSSSLTLSPAIQNRHKCIQAIRDRQSQILGPLIRRYNEAGTAALLVDPAYRKNVGDHMITLGELEFLSRLGFSGPQRIQQCGYVQAGSFVDSCEDFLQSTRTSEKSSVLGHHQQVALWHGGGNWGDIWQHIQPKRIGSFSLLLQKSYSIVGMPQSLYYSDKSLGEMDAAHLKESISNGLGYNNNSDDNLNSVAGRKMALDRIHLAWREVESYNQANELYPFVTNLLVPDIAFQLGPYEALPPRAGSSFDVDLLFFLRDDRESTLSQYRTKGAIRKILESTTGTDGLKLMIVDWGDRLDLFDSKDHFFTNTSIQLLSMGRVVICDRLHAAILCYLSGIPFVYIDQSTGKITKSLRVAFDSWEGCKNGDVAMWAGAETLQAAVEIATSFLQKYDLQMNRLGRGHA